MQQNENFLDELPVFVTTARTSGSSLVITLDSKVCDFLGIKEGDYIKAMIRKIEKKED